MLKICSSWLINPWPSLMRILLFVPVGPTGQAQSDDHPTAQAGVFLSVAPMGWLSLLPTPCAGRPTFLRLRPALLGPLTGVPDPLAVFFSYRVTRKESGATCQYAVSDRISLRSQQEKTLGVFTLSLIRGPVESVHNAWLWSGVTVPDRDIYTTTRSMLHVCSGVSLPSSGRNCHSLARPADKDDASLDTCGRATTHHEPTTDPASSIQGGGRGHPAYVTTISPA